MAELRIAHLYPEVMNLYGDRGNVLCMEKRLAWRGIDCWSEKIALGERPAFADYDLLFIGGGQDFDEELLVQELHAGVAKEIRGAIEDGIPFLCICGGFQILGQEYVEADGTRCELIGAIDFTTVAGQERMIGNYIFALEEESGGGEIVGFENHSGRTRLGHGVRPLGHVVKGFGNNGEDGTEGVRYRNVFGTYCHGPLLPKNPAFCDYILQTALERKYGSYTLEPLDDTAEWLAHDTVKKSIMEGTAEKDE